MKSGLSIKSHLIDVVTVLVQELNTLIPIAMCRVFLGKIKP